jgi:hypothetical protein
VNFTSSSNCFCIKNAFTKSFVPFKLVLDWVSIFRKIRGLGATKPKTRGTIEVDGGLFS